MLKLALSTLSSFLSTLSFPLPTLSSSNMLKLALLLICLDTSTHAEELSLALISDGLKRQQVLCLEEGIKEAGYPLVDSALAASIARGLELPELFNLSLREAAGLGAAIGVDGYILTRLKSFDRVGGGGRLYGESFLAVAIVGSRSGKLLDFQFHESQGKDTEESARMVIKDALLTLPDLLKRFREGYLKQFQPPEIDPMDAGAIQADKSAPEVLERSRPSYSEIAEKMRYSARVELEVVLRGDGSVGRVSVTRWAGHGLDEAAVAAMRKLRFRPALLEGKPVNCLISAVYNFNYIRK